MEATILKNCRETYFIDKFDLGLKDNKSGFLSACSDEELEIFQKPKLKDKNNNNIFDLSIRYVL